MIILGGGKAEDGENWTNDIPGEHLQPGAHHP